MNYYSNYKSFSYKRINITTKSLNFDAGVEVPNALLQSAYHLPAQQMVLKFEHTATFQGSHCNNLCHFSAQLADVAFLPPMSSQQFAVKY